MKRILGSLFAILAIAMFVMACGDDKKSNCPDGQVMLAFKVNGVEGEQKCYTECETTAGCPNKDTQECRGVPKVCRDKAVVDTNNTPNNTIPPVETPTISDVNKQLCADHCDLSFGCIYEWCGAENLTPGLIGNCMNGFPPNEKGEPGEPGCIPELTGTSAQAAEIEAKAAEYRKTVYREDGITKQTCDDSSYMACVYGSILQNTTCGCEPSKKLGDTCVKPEDCESGTLLGACLAEKQGDKETGFKGGYCASLPCDHEYGSDKRIVGSANPDSLGCGEGNYCIMTRYNAQTVLGFCNAGCKEQSDCRDGYTCNVGGVVIKGTKETMAKTCTPAICKTDSDCGSGENQGRCNVDTKACELPCSKAEDAEFCLSGDGVCTADGDKKFCVLS